MQSLDLLFKLLLISVNMRTKKKYLEKLAQSADVSDEEEKLAHE